MKWSETILFHAPLREISFLTGAPSENWDVLARAREDAGYQRGRRDGEDALREQLVQQRTEIVELQRGVLQALKNALPQLIQESETALIGLALEAAKKVIANLPIDVGLVESVVKEALRQVEDSAEILVQLHSEDLALLRTNDSTLLDGLPDKGPLRFIGSSEVTRGGCLIQTRFGLIDARREVKLEQLTQTLAT